MVGGNDHFSVGQLQNESQERYHTYCIAAEPEGIWTQKAQYLKRGVRILTSVTQGRIQGGGAWGAVAPPPPSGYCR